MASASATAAELAQMLADKAAEYEELQAGQAALVAERNTFVAESERRQREQDARERTLREREHAADIRAAREGTIDARLENLARRELECQAREAQADASDAALKRREKGKYTSGGPPMLLVALLSEGDCQRVCDAMPASAWRWTRDPEHNPVAILRTHAAQALATASYPGNAAPADHLRRMCGRMAEAAA